MRSNSRKVLAPLFSSVSFQEGQRSVKRAKSNHVQCARMSGLKRSLSSVGRLQNRKSDSFSLYEDESALPPKENLNGSASVRSPGTDSDKENHDPNILATRAVSYHPPKHSKRRTLKQARTAPIMTNEQEGSAAEPGRRNAKELAAKENFDPEQDQELASFMGSSGKRSRKGQAGLPGEEDMDCVHGLLSLSQGNWK